MLSTSFEQGEVSAEGGCLSGDLVGVLLTLGGELLRGGGATY